MRLRATALASLPLLLGIATAGCQITQTQTRAADALTIDNGLFNNGLFNNGLFNNGLYNNGMYNNGLYNNGLFNNGMYNNGLYNNGLYNNGLFNNGLYNNGLYNNGLYNNGLYNNGRATQDWNFAAGSPQAASLSLANAFESWLESGAVVPHPLTQQNVTMTELLMKYIVECALPEDESLTFTAPTSKKQYAWAGLMGLTVTFDAATNTSSSWGTAPMTPTQQAWVSACVLARVNALGQPVRIELRGDPTVGSSLSISGGVAPLAADVAPDYLEEGAMWGNIFVPPGTPGPQLRNCDGRNNGAGASDGRTCDFNDGTSKSYCSNWDNGSAPSACATNCLLTGAATTANADQSVNFKDQHYVSCSDAYGNGSAKATYTATQVVTVFVHDRNPMVHLQMTFKGVDGRNIFRLVPEDAMEDGFKWWLVNDKIQWYTENHASLAYTVNGKSYNNALTQLYSCRDGINGGRKVLTTQPCEQVFREVQTNGVTSYWVTDRSLGRIYTGDPATLPPGAVPLYHFYSPDTAGTTGNDMYTVDPAAVSTFLQTGKGWTGSSLRETSPNTPGVIGYVWTNPDGTQPTYQWQAPTGHWAQVGSTGAKMMRAVAPHHHYAPGTSSGTWYFTGALGKYVIVENGVVLPKSTPATTSEFLPESDCTAIAPSQSDAAWGTFGTADCHGPALPAIPPDPVLTPPCTAQTASDVNNCGACGNVCASGQVCTSGVCTDVPPPPPECQPGIEVLPNGVSAIDLVDGFGANYLLGGDMSYCMIVTGLPLGAPDGFTLRPLANNRWAAPSNGGDTGLSQDQFCAVIRGDVTTWSDGTPITVVYRLPGSAGGYAINNTCGADGSQVPGAIGVGSEGAVNATVAATPGAVGYATEASVTAAGVSQALANLISAPVYAIVNNDDAADNDLIDTIIANPNQVSALGYDPLP